MAEPFLGQISMVGFNFAPRGWAECAGQLLSISQNSALFALLGTTYGGDGRTTFGLPDLRGRVPINFGQGPGLSNYSLGQQGGTENTTLTVNNLPAHTHPLAEANAKAVIGCRTDAANATGPGGNYLGTTSTNTYVSGQSANNNIMNAGTVSFAAGGATNPTGGNQPVSNAQPYLCVNFIIALQGIFPSRS